MKNPYLMLNFFSYLISYECVNHLINLLLHVNNILLREEMTPEIREFISFQNSAISFTADKKI